MTTMCMQQKSHKKYMIGFRVDYKLLEKILEQII